MRLSQTREGRVDFRRCVRRGDCGLRGGQSRHVGRLEGIVADLADQAGDACLCLAAVNGARRIQRQVRERGAEIVELIRQVGIADLAGGNPVLAIAATPGATTSTGISIVWV